MTDEHLLCEDARVVDLDPLALAQDAVLSGTPSPSIRELARIGGVEVGIWELTTGTVRDTEVDEVFVVLAGEATVRWADGTSLELRTGSVVRLHEGERTEWEVRSTLRKIYVSA